MRYTIYWGLFGVGTLQQLLALQKCKQRPCISKYCLMWIACECVGIRKFLFILMFINIILNVYNNVPSNVMVNKNLWINVLKLQRKKEDAFEEIRLCLNLSEISLSWTLYLLIFLKRNTLLSLWFSNGKIYMAWKLIDNTTFGSLF